MTETLTADGVSTAFTTLSSYIPGSLKVYVDGIRYTMDDDYTETAGSETNIGFELAVPVPIGSSFVIDYDTVGGGGLIASGS